LFILENTVSLFSVSNISQNIRYRVRYLNTKQYLVSDVVANCFTVTNDASQSSVWEDTSGNNTEWTLTTPTETGERRTIIRLSVLKSKTCPECTKETVCNYFDGSCGECGICSGDCPGPCPSGFTCKITNEEYSCVEINTRLRTLLIFLGVSVFVILVIAIAFFASR